MVNRNPIVIISCGSKKTTKKMCPAFKLYVGNFFKAQLKWALSITDKDSVFILSAKHGFLRLFDLVEPYELKMGQLGCVSEETLRRQSQLFYTPNRAVLTTAGKNYRKILKSVFPQLRTPFKGCSGMGYMIQSMNKNIGRIP